MKYKILMQEVTTEGPVITHRFEMFKDQIQFVKWMVKHE